MDETVWKDVRSIIELHRDYVSAEPYIDYDYEYRIQRIGSVVRVFKRISSSWKGNTSVAKIDEVEVTPQFRMWATECSKLVGGMDILALDVLHRASDDSLHILEVNDTAIGLVHAYEAADHALMRDLLLLRLSQARPLVERPLLEAGEEKSGEEEEGGKEEEAAAGEEEEGEEEAAAPAAAGEEGTDVEAVEEATVESDEVADLRSLVEMQVEQMAKLQERLAAASESDSAAAASKSAAGGDDGCTIC
eukprot:PLAT9386.1.p1 GENE.PLAT9386.1~~PLAT9386.1.p1  ORF type:complete len:248 (-),score=118.59 PLAT9386.1:81-824(-)